MEKIRGHSAIAIGKAHGKPVLESAAIMAAGPIKEGKLEMATNPPKGDNHRNGAVKDRSQTYNPTNDRWVKRDTDNGRFIDQKADPKPFKGVRKEK